ncbi:hypothetical protein [Salipaludibacillus daqingensis]|uniref:hypothetical protein n=1 Tax=Salipaludibacillus daqingensis TaxID=3041001 RepID=UPI0024736B15|nr:hypothetical protein [Salipaludibacillus daqingensis]
MTEKLEIRGIHHKDIISYLMELGGEKVPSEEDFVVIDSKEWKCTVSPEQFFTFMHSSIPKVHLEFQSDNSELLTEVLRKFRLKTFRAGG